METFGAATTRTITRAEANNKAGRRKVCSHSLDSFPMRLKSEHWLQTIKQAGTVGVTDQRPTALHVTLHTTHHSSPTASLLVRPFPRLFPPNDDVHYCFRLLPPPAAVPASKRATRTTVQSQCCNLYTVCGLCKTGALPLQYCIKLKKLLFLRVFVFIFGCLVFTSHPSFLSVISLQRLFRRTRRNRRCNGIADRCPILFLNRTK